MSLYNAIHGVNPLAGLLLGFLDLDAAQVPRFRDVYITPDGLIAVHTRTGGGNRLFYESEERCREEYPEAFDGSQEAPSGPWNDDLRKVAGFSHDEDDEFDATYATFFFKPETDIAPFIEEIQRVMGSETPAEKWQKLFADMEANRNTPRVARALDAGRPIIEAIEQLTKGD